MWRALLLLPLACGAGSDDPGLGAWLRVSGARFVAGPPPEAADGPAVRAFSLSRNTAARGDPSLHAQATLDAEATGVSVWLVGDRGHWLMPASLPDVSAPGLPTANFTAALASDAPLGARAVQLQALVPRDVSGPVSRVPLEVTAPAARGGALIITLSWDTPSDLDLHVVDAQGVEIWARDANSSKASLGMPIDPKSGGLLDADSNGKCIIDGRNSESVAWEKPPPSGRYVVRVDTFSLCGQAVAHWRVSATLEGTSLAIAEGTSTPDATRPPHELGSGVIALEFDVP